MADNNDQNKKAVMLSLGLGAFGALLLAWMTGPHGLSVSSASVRYFQAAKAFATGEVTPSFYAAVLSAGFFAGMGIAEWSRAVAIFLFGLNIALVCGLVFWLTGKLRPAFILGAAVILTTPVLEIHAAALPCSLGLALILGVVWALACALKLSSLTVVMAEGFLSRRWSTVFKGILVLCAVLMSVITIGRVLELRQKGQGFNAPEWTDTALVKTVKTLADQVPVYTNDPQVFYFYAGRAASPVGSARSGGACPVPAEEMRRDFLERGAVAVFFDVKALVPAACWGELVRTAPLTVLFRDARGVILGYRPAVDKARQSLQGGR